MSELEGRRVPKVIEVESTPTGVRLRVDGVLFPYLTGPEGWTVQVHRGQLPGVTITLVAERLLVDHALRKSPNNDGPVSTGVGEFKDPIAWVKSEAGDDTGSPA